MSSHTPALRPMPPPISRCYSRVIPSSAWRWIKAAISPTAPRSTSPASSITSFRTASIVKPRSSTMTSWSELAEEHHPKLIVAGFSAYPRRLDFARFRQIADGVGALVMADIAHVAGLVVAGLYPSPMPYCQVVTTTTHKTLRGPRGAIILCTGELAAKIDKGVFPGTQGGPLMNTIAAKAVAFKEAASPEFRRYQRQVVDNAQVLAAQSAGERLSAGIGRH